MKTLPTLLFLLLTTAALAEEAKPCVFCEIVAGQREAAIVYRDADVVAFMDNSPQNPGHVLVLPVRHADGIRRLDYEMRWYVVTDRSLRIRTGVWSVQETTMSFANLQQVEVSQGPLQRLLKLADVTVQSAGGSDSQHGKPQDDLHTGHFHGVENAHEIRDLIQDRLRRFRESGLGDPEEVRRAAAAMPAPAPASMVQPVAETNDADVLAAARELAAEAKALRVALG